MIGFEFEGAKITRMLKIQNGLLEENLCNHMLFFQETDMY